MFGIGRAQSGKGGTSGGAEGAMFRAMVAAMEEALLVYDENFFVRFMNPAAERLFGITHAELIATALTPKEVENPKLKRLVQTIFPTLAPSIAPRSKSGEFPQVIDITFENPYLELRTTTSAIANDAGRATGFMKIIRDRTREVSLGKTKTEFITVASHQLRTPITNLAWTLETLMSDPGLPEGTRLLVEGALVSAKELQGIVEDLLNISKIEEGRFGYAFEKTNLVDFVEQFLAQALDQAKKVGIGVYFDPPQTLVPEVAIDRSKLAMVLHNLLDNAIRYNVERGTVTVTIVPKAGEPYLEVAVKDTGIGISAADAEKLFTKFFRAENAVQAVADGSGLGLYITKNIVEAHGGQIWVESVPGRGSTFRFTVPTDTALIPQKEVPLEY